MIERVSRRIRIHFAIIAVVAGIAAADENVDELKRRVEGNREFRAGYSLITDSKAFNDERKWGRNCRRAIKHFDKAIELGVRTPDIYCFRGIAWWDLGECEKALKSYDLAVKVGPARDEIISGRVGLLLEMGHLERAKRDQARLKELESEFAESTAKEIERFLQTDPLGRGESTCQNGEDKLKTKGKE